MVGDGSLVTSVAVMAQVPTRNHSVSSILTECTYVLVGTFSTLMSGRRERELAAFDENRPTMENNASTYPREGTTPVTMAYPEAGKCLYAHIDRAQAVGPHGQR